MLNPTHYDFGLLTPTLAPGAEAANAPLLDALTFGIEVTEPELASQCGLGNLDPQHGLVPEGRAAIEAALECPLPPSGSRLVTLRPDADALGAMAVLSLRAEGIRLGSEGLETVGLIARWDRFAHGPWESYIAERGPLLRPAKSADVTDAPESYAAFAALASDQRRSIAERVRIIRHALITSELPGDVLDAAGRWAVALAEAWNSGRIGTTRLADAPVALLRGDAPGSLGLGYRFAPVVIAELARTDAADDLPRKVTIAQFDAGRADLRAVAAALSAVEPGWGGGSNIVGSPQGVGSRLPLATLEQTVKRCLYDSSAIHPGTGNTVGERPTR